MRGKRCTDGWLTAEWSKRERDILYHYPSKPDGHLLHCRLGVGSTQGKALLDELEERGYDLTTLQFSIRRREPGAIEQLEKGARR